MATGVALLGFWLAVIFTQTAGEHVDTADIGVLRTIARARTGTLTSVAKGIDAIGGDWIVRILRWGAIGVMLVWRRFRHLLIFAAAILVAVAFAESMAELFGRPRPLGVEILGVWEGFSMPSVPVVHLSATLLGFTYAVVVPGRPRSLAKWVVGAFIAVFVLARLYLAVDNPTDVLSGVILGVAIPVVAFRMFAPNDVFPVRYKRGRAAHLDLTGIRGEAIRHAVSDQLGMAVIDVKAFGLEGSGGSTPMRLEVEAVDGTRTRVFAKLYAAQHLRADRWYKLGRTLLYGRLEDEAPFSTVRRLVQYEDYLLHVMHAAGLPVARPFGFVELTPEREYLIVTGFFEGATEIGDVDVDDDVIDDALGVVHMLWEAGLAHRDIKPANLLVDSEGHVRLIDVAFSEVRPSPWRQAVDLGNMMLVLALRSSARQVYERARLLFTEDEIGEAFAATRGLTMPSQLRALLRAEARDLQAEFLTFAPRRPKIRIQRWSARRVLLLLGVAVTVFIAFGMVLNFFIDASLV